MSSEPAISVQHVSKSYDLGLSGRTTSLATIARERLRHPIRGGGSRRERFNALDDITFDVEQGEVVGVIGRNGAGKSTLLKILSRITPPSAGHIDMAGSVGSLLEVGTGFHPELTGLENVYLNGTILGMTRRDIERRLDAIVDFAEVHKFLDTPVKRYSSGMRVRLAFAVAAHLEPEILIVDEVLSVGDQAFQAKCLEKMRTIVSEKGRTILYVSHNLVTVEHLCPRSLLLDGGRLVYDGETRDTITRYLHAFGPPQHGDMHGVFDLTAGDHGRGDYLDLFRRLELRPGGGAPSDKVRMGERLRIEIAVNGLDEVAEPILQVTVGSPVSHALFRMRSNMLPLQAAHARRRTERVVIDIPSLPLVPGEYHLHLVARDGHNTIVDHVDRAAEFTVLPADVLGHGYQFVANDGYFMVPWEWEICPDDGEVAPVDVNTAEAV